ncbi:ATP-binding cassette sub-family C member 4-like [Cotesia typhae]|uniref:ATP-binding cassette sub-family C member 4-like n=1 Tax=Cotesia typhae TaxID=2053667 RepID=UPI003D690ABC
MTEKLRRNPVETANPISWLFFWWTLDLFKKGSKDGVKLEDLYMPLASDQSKTLTDDLEKSWNIELQKLKLIKDPNNNNKSAKTSKPRLLKALMRTFSSKFLIISAFQAIEQLVLLNLLPLILNKIIRYFESDIPEMQKEVFGWAACLICVTLSMLLIMHHTSFFGQVLGMRIRVACSSLIYRKSLKLSRLALNDTPVGQVVNLLSNDVSRFDSLPVYVNYLWITPIQIIVIGYIIWRSIGIYTLVGYGMLFLITIPMQSYVGIVTGKLRKVTAMLTDRRVQFISELISGIQVIKMYAWEKPFEMIVTKSRLEEIKKVHYSNKIKALYTNLSEFTQKIMTFTTIVVFILNGNSLPTRQIFGIIIYYNTLELLMTLFFPMSIVLLIQSLIAIKRIEEFLLLEEVKKDTKALDIGAQMPEVVEDSLKKKANPGAVVVKLDKVSANWKFGQLPPTLNDVSLKINKGELCILVGPVGSGKSSLLNVLLQELSVGAGTVELLQFSDGETAEAQSKSGFSQDNPAMIISYASQDSWLFRGSVRENILFGQEYDKARYQEVMKVCSLLQDFKQLPKGDLTIVGERGASLSGGQRARINLARAIYRPADLYLLDDPLSAVDARVSRQLFEDCILGYLKGKTRILVTHQLNYLKQADTITVIEQGSIKHQCTFDSLTTTNFAFNNMVNDLQENRNEPNTIPQTNHQALPPENIKQETFFRRLKRNISQVSVRSYESFELTNEFDDAVQRSSADETMRTGIISKKVYNRYLLEGGGMIGIILLIILFIVTQLVAVGVDQWMTYWMRQETIRSASNSSQTDLDLDNDLISTYTTVYVYLGLLVTFIILSMSRCYYLILIGIRAAEKLHDIMLNSILGTTMHFFHTNPAGRLLNRFSKDMGTVDDLLLPDLMQAAIIISLVSGTFINIAIVNPWMIILVLILGVLFSFLIKYYLRTAQDVKRLESIVKSPVFTHVNSTFNGLTTIRSRDNHEKQMLRSEFDLHQDNHTKAWYLVIASGTAFGLGVDLIACFFTTILTFCLIILNLEYNFGATAGLAISQSLILTGTLKYGIKQATKVQSQMTAVERIIQYTDLPKEGPIESSEPLPENWPSKGRIMWKNVYLNYKKDDPAILKNIDLMIEPGWKVGVVGRTGAGKSSLISALFRLVDDGLEGQIIIDGVDTKTVGLQDLRSSISIIPQEPVLFSQTLRYNLDPFGKYTDKEIWDALREVELSDLALDQWVTEGGTNFSVGQRQLICLVRALLRNNRILVLDEATANIDCRTDTLIQRAIRSKFADCTVITIAHRLNTIINSDRILVMDNGCAAEFDTPYKLLIEKPDSIFAKMVEQTGPSTAFEIMQQVTEHPQSQLIINDSQKTFTYDSFLYCTKL